MKKSFGAKVVSAVNVPAKDWKAVAWTTVLTAAAAGITYLSSYLGEVDPKTLGTWGPLVMTAVVPLMVYVKGKIQDILKGGKPPLIFKDGRAASNVYVVEPFNRELRR